MTTRSPPRLATWLLEGLGTGTRVEELIGDLTEQFTQGRSRLWYWRQALAALALDIGRMLRTQAPSFVAAVFAGYALTQLWLLGNSLAFGPLYKTLDAGLHPLSWEMLSRFLGLRAAQLSLIVLTFISGWIVTRIHRVHQRAVVLVFVCAMLAQRLPRLADLIVAVADGSRPLPALIPQIVHIALQGVFTAVAGLWVIRRERFADMDSRSRRVAIMTVVLALASSLLYDAWRVGALAYPPAERYPVDAAEIASGAYLAFLLWRLGSPPMPTRILLKGVGCQ